MTFMCAPCLREARDAWYDSGKTLTPTTADLAVAVDDAVTVVDGTALCFRHATAKPQGGWVLGV
jgi:hypothetical protein